MLITLFKRVAAIIPMIVAASFICFATWKTNGQRLETTPISLNECWQYPSDSIQTAQPATDAVNLYFAEVGGRITAISLSTGLRVWSTDLGGEVRSNVAVHGSSVFVVTGPAFDGTARANGRLRSLSSATGVPSLDVTIPYSEDVRLDISGGNLIAVQNTGIVTAYDPGLSRQVWSRSLPAVATAAFDGDRLLLAAADRTVHVISTKTGKELMAANSNNVLTAIAAVNDDILWGDDRGNVVRYDADKHSVVWRFRNGARISDLTVTSEGIVVTSLDNFVYLISESNGVVRWKKRQVGRISDITLDRGSLGVVITVGEPNAAVLDIQNGKTVGVLTIRDNEAFIRRPIFSNGRFIFFTTERIMSRSLLPCSSK